MEKVVAELNNMSSSKSNVIAIVTGVVVEAAREVLKNGDLDFTNWKSAVSALLVALAVAAAHRISPPKN